MIQMNLRSRNRLTDRTAKLRLPKGQRREDKLGSGVNRHTHTTRYKTDKQAPAVYTGEATAPTPVLLPGEPQGQGLQPMGSLEVGHN